MPPAHGFPAATPVEPVGFHFPNKEMQMAFDAKQAVIDKLTILDDDLKQAKARETTEAKRNAAAVADIEAEIDGWQKLLAGAEPAPAAKKTASKK